MTRRETIVFWGGVLFLIVLFSLAVWPVLLLFSWYIKRIPAKRLPLTSLLASNQKKCYEWASGFLRGWVKRSIIYSLVLLGLGFTFGALLWVAVNIVKIPLPILADLLGILTTWLATVVFIYATIVVSTLWALRVTKTFEWDVLFGQAEPAARMLVGNDEYEKMDEEAKNRIKRNIVDSMIGINKATLVVAGGEMLVKNLPAEDLARFGGPGVLIVQEGHAVILEQGGKISRIEGRGVHFLEMFERVSMVVPLTLRSELCEIKNVITQDEVIIGSIKLLVFHKVDPGKKSHENGDYPFEDAIIREKIWSPKGGDWRGLVQSVAETATRDVVARYTLEDLVLASAETRERLRNELKNTINNVTKDKLGIEVTTVAIGETKVPEDAEKKLLERWLASVKRRIKLIEAEAERDALIRRGEGEAQAVRRIGLAKISIRDAIIAQLTGPILDPSNASAPIADPGVAIRFVTAIERLSGLVMQDNVTAIRYVEALEKLCESPTAKTIVLGETRGMLELSPSEPA